VIIYEKKRGLIPITLTEGGRIPWHKAKRNAHEIAGISTYTSLCHGKFSTFFSQGNFKAKR